MVFNHRKYRLIIPCSYDLGRDNAQPTDRQCPILDHSFISEFSKEDKKLLHSFFFPNSLAEVAAGCSPGVWRPPMSRKALQSDLPLPEAGIQGGLDGRLGNFLKKTLKSCFIPSPLGGGENWEFFFGGVSTLG